MDPPSMMTNDGAFRSANAATYNFTEIWPFPINVGGAIGGESGSELDLRVQFGQCLGQFADNASANRDVSVDDPMVLDQRETHNDGGARKRREQDESVNGVSTNSSSHGMLFHPFIDTNDCDTKRLKTLGSSDENRESKAVTEANSGKPAELSTKLAVPPKQDYIHVRARRGQATDSHSLAERARREKISERMKILQDLVPGCNKNSKEDQDDPNF